MLNIHRQFQVLYVQLGINFVKMKQIFKCFFGVKGKETKMCKWYLQTKNVLTYFKLSVVVLMENEQIWGDS